METFSSAKSIIEKSRNIFILTPPHKEENNLVGALALFYILKKLDKNVNLVIDEIPERLKFLNTPNYLTSMKNRKNLVISLDTSKNEISELRYEKRDKNILKIYFSLDEGNLEPKDVSFETQTIEPDLLICIGSESTEGLGKFFIENPKIFQETSIMNVDSNIDNKNFGKVNLVFPLYSGTSEVVGDFLNTMYPELIDTNIANSLLAGIIIDTQNFQNRKTTPKSLNLASILTEKGARQYEIIQNLYGNKSLGSVKLLGKALEGLHFDKEKDLYWVSFLEEDFKDANASQKDLKNVLEELKLRFLDSKSLLLLWESHGSGKLTRGIFYSPNKTLVEKLSKTYESSQKGQGLLFLVRDPDISQVKDDVLNILN